MMTHWQVHFFNVLLLSRGMPKNNGETTTPLTTRMFLKLNFGFVENLDLAGWVKFPNSFFLFHLGVGNILQPSD